MTKQELETDRKAAQPVFLGEFILNVDREVVYKFNNTRHGTGQFMRKLAASTVEQMRKTWEGSDARNVKLGVVLVALPQDDLEEAIARSVHRQIVQDPSAAIWSPL